MTGRGPRARGTGRRTPEVPRRDPDQGRRTGDVDPDSRTGDADPDSRTGDADRDSRTGQADREADEARERAQEARDRLLDRCLVRIRDLAGRPRGTGFAADHHGTVITSHESVDGLSGLVLHTPGGDRTCVVTADHIVPLPGLGLALVRTEGLDVEPLPVTVRDGVETGTYVRIAAGRWREARVLGPAPATYTTIDGFHLLDGALELAIGTAGRDALRLGGGAAGGPVLDAATGAVVAVLGTALRSGERDAGFAVPLRPATEGPLAELLTRNAATVPAYGADLNLAGVLELTATSVGQDGPPTATTPPGRQEAEAAWREAAPDGVVRSGPGGPERTGPDGPLRPLGEAVPVSGSAAAPDLAADDTGSGPAGPGGTRGAGQDLTGMRWVGLDGSVGAVRAGCGDAARVRWAGPGESAGAAPEGSVGAGRHMWVEGHLGTVGSGGRSDAVPLGAVPLVAGESGRPAGVPPQVRAAVVPVTGRAVVVPVAGRAAVPVERPDVVRELAVFTEGPARVLGLVGAPGCGRTTELAALAARRSHGAEPAPTLWLRGADLAGADTSVADAARRALDRAARIVAASRAPFPVELTDLTPERLAHLARAGGRPLLLLLDGPEEMPLDLSHRLSEWSEGTARWLRQSGARLVVACREEYWEDAGARFPADLLHAPAGPEAPGHLPSCLRLGDLTPDEAREARSRYGIPDCVLEAADARHPLTLRLFSEIRAALPDAAHTSRAALPDAAHSIRTARTTSTIHTGQTHQTAETHQTAHGTRIDRHDVLSAHLDLMCLRIAVRLAAENGAGGRPGPLGTGPLGTDPLGPRGKGTPRALPATSVRRLAAKVAGQVHEAARRCLGPGEGELDRASFEEVFPWGPAPARLGGGTGWASAVLSEGLLVPAGGGYRFAHEELADWIQGTHLDLDEALRVLVHRAHTPGAPHPLPAPHHRIGPVVQALLLLSRQHGAPRLAVRLEELLCALDHDPHSWWASRLLAGVLLRVPDATPYARVLRLLAERIVAWREIGRPVPRGFGPGFWTALPLPDADRCDLLRRLLLADDAPHGSGTPRYLDAAAQLLAADPTAVQPHLTRWFDDERPLPATPHATVATAAQALLHTHRHRALDDLTEALAASAHPRAEELLTVLAEEETSALCRAVERWAHDERPVRRAAAAAHGLRAAPHARADADREPLRHAALALLARPTDTALHGAALALLVRDPHTRSRHLPQALGYFAAGDAHLPPSALAPALTTHPEAVLTAFGDRLRRGPDAPEALRTLVGVTTPPLVLRVVGLLRETAGRRPEIAGQVAACVDRRLDHGPAVRAVLFPLVTGLLDGGPERLRAALAAVLATPGAPASRPLRRELLDFLLAHEREPAVLDAVLHAAAPTAEEDLRALVHRTGLLLGRTPEGATVFDRGLVEVSRHVPGFAARMAGWLTEVPQDWAALVGPSARRTIENLAGTGVPV
ncbi:serine protease [Streptomyces sp. NPDC096152]|uniref:serine protease n=1 Tax=Streptomyces sp. NPDC096152 TaxID=3366078 RepID=UPI0037F86814